MRGDNAGVAGPKQRRVLVVHGGKIRPVWRMTAVAGGMDGISPPLLYAGGAAGDAGVRQIGSSPDRNVHGVDVRRPIPSASAAICASARPCALAHVVSADLHSDRCRPRASARHEAFGLEHVAPGTLRYRMPPADEQSIGVAHLTRGLQRTLRPAKTLPRLARSIPVAPSTKTACRKSARPRHSCLQPEAQADPCRRLVGHLVDRAFERNTGTGGFTGRTHEKWASPRVEPHGIMRRGDRLGLA